MRSFVLGAAVLAATFFSYEGWQTVKNLKNHHTLIQQQEMTELTTSWTDSAGLTHTVKTTRTDPTETSAELAARHKADVDALKALYPPAT